MRIETITELIELSEEQAKSTMLELVYSNRELKLDNDIELYNQVYKIYEENYKTVISKKLNDCVIDYAHDIISPILAFATVEDSMNLVKMDIEYRNAVEDIYLSTIENETQYTVDDLLGY